MSRNIMIGGYFIVGDWDVTRLMKCPREIWQCGMQWVAGLTQFEFKEEGLSLFSNMHGSGFLPDEFTLGSVLRG